MTHLLIIGSGGAGLSAAITAKEAGIKEVTVVTKHYPTNAQTSMAQGGINAALGNVEPDSVEEHIKDTLRSAKGLADEAMVRTLCKSAPEVITFLERIGVPFSRIEGAKEPLRSIAQRKMGGASSKRACYAQDYTGLKILHTLYDYARKLGVKFVCEHYLLDLIVRDGDVEGALFWDIAQGKVQALTAQATVLATGGYGGLYHGYTTNMYGASGDGISAALRAGAQVSDMEFIQFHPTALAHSKVLMSESARGEGGHLINDKGERFVDELAPRDVVARAIFEQITQGKTVYLDLRPVGKEKLQTLLPQEIELAKRFEGIDVLKEPVPIMPATHYTMGGIDVDNSYRVHKLQRLYAIGECANAHVHGANRLGGNSLLEIIASGMIASKDIAQSTHKQSLSDHEPSIQKAQSIIKTLFEQSGYGNLYAMRTQLGKTLYEHAGIVRHNDGLYGALNVIEGLQNRLPKVTLTDKSLTHNTQLVEYLELRNALVLAPLIVKSAILRCESRGAHYRSDYPKQDDATYQRSYTLTLPKGRR